MRRDIGGVQLECRRGIALVVVLLATVLGAAASQAESEFRLVHSTPTGAVFEYASSSGADWELGASPAELAPVEVAWLAIPEGATVRATLEIIDRQQLVPIDLAPGLAQELSAHLTQSVELAGRPQWIRNQYAAPLRFQPVRETGFGRYDRVTHARVEVSFLGGQASSRRLSTGRDPFENVYENQFLNYEEGKSWRKAPVNRAWRSGSPYFSSTNQPWIRLRTTHEDIYQVSGSDLELLGIDLEMVDPLTLRLFTSDQVPIPEESGVHETPSWMDEMAIRLEGMEDGRFDTGDRILFLGYGPDCWWTSKGQFPPGLEQFARDPYTNENAYWLTWGGSFEGSPMRIESVDGSDVAEPVVTRVRDKIHLEEDLEYDSRYKDLSGAGAYWETYFWEHVRSGDRASKATITLRSIPDPVATESAEIHTRLWGASKAPGSLPDHNIRVSLNGNVFLNEQWDGKTRKDVTATGSFLVPGDTQVVLMELEDWELQYDQVYLDYLELTYTRDLIAHEDRIEFFPTDFSGVHSFEVRGFDTDTVVVFDASDPRRPRVIGHLLEAAGGSNKVRFRAGLTGTLPARFVLRSAEALSTPQMEVVFDAESSYLRERTDAVQMIIIAHEEFFGQAERLAEYRRSHFPDRTNASVSVVDVEQIYDEFGLGRKDPVAIRNFLELAVEQWSGGNPDDAPAYVLLFGDAHRDMRAKVTTGHPDLVPTYTKYYYERYLDQIYEPRYSSDDFFALLDGPGDQGMDLFVGRFACHTQTHAEVLVDKVFSYESADQMGAWRNRVTLVADDICQGLLRDSLGWLHLIQTEELATLVFPETLELDRIYMIEYGGIECRFSNKPDAAAALLDAMNSGTLVVNYTGHGSETQAADERVFEISTVGSLTNEDQLFLFLTASCSVGKFDSSKESLAEALMRHPNGGSIIVFSASSVASATSNGRINKGFFNFAFPDKRSVLSRPVGEASVNAKLLDTSVNTRRFALHGDPAVRLASARHDIEVELFDANTSAALGDTLWRGGAVEIRGSVRDDLGNPLSGFNGEAMVNVYDTDVLKQPVENDRGKDYFQTGVPIYRGSARVSGGEFTMKFQVPSALRTGALRGKAKVYVYATGSDGDANGVLAHLAVPEVAAPSNPDSEGPTMSLRFDGDLETVPAGAAFTANLNDVSGINVTGLVSSRSVVFRIEDDGTTIFAEDISSSVAFGESYQMAEVVHSLPINLPVGRRYEAVLEASDNLNNRSSIRTSFFLSDDSGASFGIADVFNFPNPTEGATRFFGKLSQEANVSIQVFTLSGKRLYRSNEVRIAPGPLETVGIPWDGRDLDGDSLANGVYFYKITASPVSGGKAHTVIERLVVSR